MMMQLSRVPYFIFGNNFSRDGRDNDWGIKEISVPLRRIQDEIRELCRSVKVDQGEMPNVPVEGAPMFEVIDGSHLLIGIYPDADDQRPSIRCVGIDVWHIFRHAPTVVEIFDTWNLLRRSLITKSADLPADLDLAGAELALTGHSASERFFTVLRGLPDNAFDDAANVLLRCAAQGPETTFAAKHHCAEDLCQLAALVWENAFSKSLAWCSASADYRRFRKRVGDRLVFYGGGSARDLLRTVDVDKVNDLARQLREHRIATNPVDALARTSNFVRSGVEPPAKGKRTRLSRHKLRRPSFRDFAISAAAGAAVFVGALILLLWWNGRLDRETAPPAGRETVRSVDATA